MHAELELPSATGTYVLWLYLKKGVSINVGRLGAIHFKRGWYAYVGSAFGSGGLAARLGRHLSDQKTMRWHIDYLRAIAQPKTIWLSTDAKSKEHEWAKRIMRTEGKPVCGFGSSDCRCSSHLFYFRRYPENVLSTLNISCALLRIQIK